MQWIVDQRARRGGNTLLDSERPEYMADRGWRISSRWLGGREEFLKV